MNKKCTFEFTSMSVLRVFQTSLFISPLIIYVIVSLIVLSLTSCGKGSKNGSEQVTENVLSVAGIFSDGAPVDGGIVVVRDSNGKTFQTLTDENGIYSFVTRDLKPPYLLKGTYSKIENPTPYNYAKEIIHEKSIYSFVPKEGFQNSDILETNKDENGAVAIAHINSLSNVLVSVSGDKVLSTEELDNIITGSKDAVTFDPSNWTTILSLIQSQLCPLASAEDQAKKCSDLNFLSTPYAMNKEDKVYKLLNSIFPKISETGNESEISYLDANEVTVVSLGSQHYIEQHIPDDAELTVDKVAQVEQAQNFSNLPAKITNELKHAINPGQNSGSKPTAVITSPTQVSAPQMPVNTAPTNTYVEARIAFDQEKAKAAIQLLTESECPITISSFRVNPVDNILSSSFGKTPDYNNNRITDFDINFNGDLPGGNFEVSAYKSCKPFTFEYEFDYALNIQAKVLELPTDDGEIVRSLKKRFDACNGFANSQTEELLIKLLVAEHSVYTGGSFAGGSRSSSVDGSQISYKVAPMHYRGRFSSSEAGFQINDNCINRKSVKFVPLNDTGVTYTMDSMVGEVVYSYQNYATGIFEEKNIFRPLIFPASGTEGRFTSVLHYIDSYGRDAVFTNREPLTIPGEEATLALEQDASHGRDSSDLLIDGVDVNGKAGFHFTKLDRVTGLTVDPDVTEYGCVKDEVTGLIWEHKTHRWAVDFPLHNAAHQYSWFDPDPNTNGGYSGQEDGGLCSKETVKGDTYNFARKVNESNLCGFSDWRIPTVEEMRSLVDYEKAGNDMMVDTRFFPYLGIKEHRWSSQTHPLDASLAYGFHFYQGVAQPHEKSCTGNNQNAFLNGVVLVRNAN